MKFGNQFSALIKFQTISWYLLFVLFGFVVIFDFLSISIPFDLGFYATVVTLIVTFTKLVLMAEQFRRLGLQRYTIIAYATILVLLIIVILKVYI